MDKLCKFGREHSVLSNKYMALFCLFLCMFVPFFTNVLFFHKNPLKSIVLLQFFSMQFLCPSIHPSIHLFISWPTVVSCRNAVNNLSAWIALPSFSFIFAFCKIEKHLVYQTHYADYCWSKNTNIANYHLTKSLISHHIF